MIHEVAMDDGISPKRKKLHVSPDVFMQIRQYIDRAGPEGDVDRAISIVLQAAYQPALDAVREQGGPLEVVVDWKAEPGACHVGVCPNWHHLPYWRPLA